MRKVFSKCLLITLVLDACKSTHDNKNPVEANPTPRVDDRPKDSPSSCGAHEWSKNFDFLGKPLGGAFVKGDAWLDRPFTIGTSKIHGSQASETQDFLRSAPCLELSSVLSSGIQSRKADSEIEIPGSESIKKGDIMRYGFSLKLAATDELPTSISEFKEEVLKGESPLSVKKITANLDIQLARGASDYFISDTFKVQLDCKTPFNQNFLFKSSFARSACRLKADQATYECLLDPSKTFADRGAVKGLCRVQKNASGVEPNTLECLEAQADFTGDGCTIIGENLEILATDGQKVKFDLRAELKRQLKEGKPYYEWIVRSVTLK